MLDAAVLPSSLTTKETLDPVMARWSPTTAAPSEPEDSLECRVTIVGSDHRGEGGIVTPDIILTSSSLVDGYGLIDFQFGDGRSVLGMVIKADRSRGLVLVQVSRSGIPAMLGADRPYFPQRRYGDRLYGSRSADTEDVDRMGQAFARRVGPILKGYRLIGFRSEHGSDISAAEIKAFLNE